MWNQAYQLLDISDYKYFRYSVKVFQSLHDNFTKLYTTFETPDFASYLSILCEIKILHLA